MYELNNLGNENIVIIYNNNMFLVDLDNDSIENINYIIGLIKIICDEFVEYHDIFYNNNMIKDELLDNDASKLFDLLYVFKDIPKILFCTIGKHNGIPSLYIDGNSNSEIIDSDNFKTLMSQIDESYFKFIIINSIPFKTEQFKHNNKNSLDEVSSRSLSLKSFQTKDELHPKFWINNKINSRVRLRLLDIADDFIKDLSVNWVKPKDIVFTGSLANYNWSRYSDIDIHIIYDYEKIYKKTELINDYFNSKKENWKQQHDRIMIYGFPVEISVEDANNESTSSGVYSLNKNKWIIEPKNFDDVKLNEKFIKDKAAKIMTDIDDIEEKLKKEEDSHKIEILANKLKKIFNRIKKSRREALERSGEMSSMNIVYKLLRRTKYIDKLWDMVNNTYNKINSIK